MRRIKWTESIECNSLNCCWSCRTKESFRDGVREHFIAGPGKFPCPHKLRRLWYVGRKPRPSISGDRLYAVCKFLKINKVVEWLEEITDHQCGCELRRQEINRLGLRRWVWKKITGQLKRDYGKTDTIGKEDNEPSI